MAETLPYLATPGSILKGLEKIAAAATPTKVTGDFIKTKLGIKGGTGNSLVPFLKKIGFVNSDGSPSELYRQFRNPSEAGHAVAAAMRVGYRPLYQTNEYCHDASNTDLKGLVVQVTGFEANSSVVKLILATFHNLKSLADFSSEGNPAEASASFPLMRETPGRVEREPRDDHKPQRLGMNLSYTINLNLPATSDIAVFNSIFKSLKENLLESDDLE